MLVTGDGRFIYVSTDASTITRFDLVTNTHVVVASAGLNGPRYLTWADAGESTILFPQPNPTGTVLKADLTTTPATVTPIAGPTAFARYSVAVLSSNQLLIACATEVAEVDLTASVYTAAGPSFSASASCLRTRRICQRVTRTRPWTRRTSSRSRTARSEGPCH